jgi:hypothetical protein
MPAPPTDRRLSVCGLGVNQGVKGDNVGPGGGDSPAVSSGRRFEPRGEGRAVCQGRDRAPSSRAGAAQRPVKR